MAHSHTAALFAVLLIAALSTAAAQPVTPILTAPGPAADPTSPDLAAPATAPAADAAAAPVDDTNIATTTVGSGSGTVTAAGVAPSSSALAGGEVCYGSIFALECNAEHHSSQQPCLTHGISCSQLLCHQTVPVTLQM